MKLYLKVYLFTVAFGLAYTGCAHTPTPAPTVVDPDCFCDTNEKTGQLVVKCVYLDNDGVPQVQVLEHVCSRG